MRLLTATAVICCLGALFAATVVWGQEALPAPPGERPMRPGRPDRPMMGMDLHERDMRELVELVMVVRLAKELGLNEEETVVLVGRLREFKQAVEEAQKERGQLMAELKQSLQRGADDAEIEQKLRAVVEYDNQIVAKKLDALRKLGEGLTLTQQAKLYVIVNEFEGDMRNMVHRAREQAERRGAMMREFRERRMGEGPPMPGQPPMEQRPGFGGPMGPQGMAPGAPGAGPPMRMRRPDLRGRFGAGGQIGQTPERPFAGAGPAAVPPPPPAAGE